MDRERVEIGEIVRDGLGHSLRVVDVRPGGFQVRVQPLTPVGVPAILRPLGEPVWCFRSDLRKAGE